MATLLTAVTAAAGPPPPTGGATDEPGAQWAPANGGNFQAADRPRERAIDTVVIHDIEGPGESAVRWFQNPMAKASAHYVMATDGRLWQQVREHDIAWHAGNRDTNARSVGIEHAGYAYRPGYYNRRQYEASARLVRSITTRYGIPRDRRHIIAHAEVPHPDDPAKFGGRSAHTDPGPYWDWDYYMVLVRNEARFESMSCPAVIRPGEERQATVIFTNAGDDPWPIFTSGRRDMAQQERGPVYLGVADDRPPPAAVESPLYHPTRWISPRFLAAPVAPEPSTGFLAAFTPTLRGPRVYGPVTEVVRLWKVPTAPRVPVPFGPPVRLRLVVQPWRRLYPAEGRGFAASGWNAARGKTWKRAGVGAPAVWTAALPIDGDWDVYVRPPVGANRAAWVVYTIGGRRVAVSRSRSAAWVRLGRFPSTAGRNATLKVSLEAAPGTRGIVATGPLRLVGPFTR